MAGDTRLVSESSLLMIHKPWCACSGNANELKIQIEALEKIERASINAYMERINISEEELIELLSNETWLTSDECLNMGFATDVISNNKEEAILQLELLGHDFFIYNDVHTNEVNVLYKRKDGNYGVIETND